MRRQAVAALVAGALMLAACGESSTDADPTPSRASSTPGDPVTSATSAPWVALGEPLGRCGPQPQRIADQRFRMFTMRRPGRILPAVTTGRGRTVVVLVHQTDGGGLCGWLDFAERIASVPRQSALAFDLCGFADSDCAEGNSNARQQVQQVRMAIDAAQRRLGARRVVVVGASMGGSLAVLTAAQDPRVDAAVDLSGPDEWRGALVHRQAARVRVPLLVAMADDEGPEVVAAARATAEAAASGSEFAGAEAGHGYELLQDTTGELTPLASKVLDWIARH
jgi:pimeloyl-ACP methyl ester carboxylesterase